MGMNPAAFTTTLAAVVLTQCAVLLCGFSPLVTCRFDESTHIFSVYGPPKVDGMKAVFVQQSSSQNPVSPFVESLDKAKTVKTRKDKLKTFSGPKRDGLPLEIHQHSKYVWANEERTLVFVRHDQFEDNEEDDDNDDQNRIKWREYHLDDPNFRGSVPFANFDEILFTEVAPYNILLFDSVRAIWVALDSTTAYWSREKKIYVTYKNDNFIASQLRNKFTGGRFV